ncbi:hypothetical protein NEUTE1DRAFT_97326 [Neurospora tetrasperma FGSC 2508]|uniref:Uncharacterized protein n=1 Tax=Neurospora tetrasperma (strain FGSC 2508 / ATCC MYA-4615 / P0657) TaxID=510951 RepID=F8MAJ3_NEUT8|nr:uncharacterized protein NEUTE1DRAFT_97326 [Neurospora tetrasperma FGSC 2508]EGO60114.1 hypothetical protein NEUTE1DRAFT_97326 [Neurospora tetrasperma FGSC 2508]
MTPTKEELDRALNEIKATFLSRETKLAKAYAEHPDPDAWYLNSISCLAKVAAGPPPLPSTAGHKQPAAGVGVRLGVEAEVKPEAANDSGGCNVTAGMGTTSRKRPRVQVEDGGSNGISNGTGTGKKVRVVQSPEYQNTFGGPENTTMTVRNRHPLDSSGLTSDMKVEEEATTQEIQERPERPAQRRRLTRGIRPRKRIQSSSSE